MFILGRSFLFGAFSSQAEHLRRRLRNQGFNDSSILKDLNYHKRTHKARNSFFMHISKAEPIEEFFVWHDVINNSLSPHFNNYDSPLSGPELADLWKTAFLRIRSIV